MLPDGVETYVERSRSLIDSAPQMGEENTKVKLVQPLIELLGWDLFSGEVELEYPIQIGQGHARADYALLLDGSPVVFVEAKGCDTTLTEKNRNQLSSYIRQKGAGWGLLTNGQCFEVLKREENSPVPKETSLANFPISDLQPNWNVLELLSRELVESGEAVTRANRIRARTRAKRELRNGKDEIADEIAQLIVGRIGDTLVQEVEAESKEFVDELSEVLGNGTETRPKSDTPPLADEYVVVFNGNGDRTSSGGTQSDSMASAVTTLIERYGLLDEIDMPYVPGKKDAILNTEPKHPSGEEMRQYRAVGGDHYLYTSLNKGSKMRYIDRFAEHCGVTVEYAGNW